MNDSRVLDTFQPHGPDAAGVLTWIHIGDLHMRQAGQENDLDLEAIVAEINAAFADSISFVFLPGDNADHGDLPGYTAVRRSLDRLQAPWCAIVGDHDVEQKSFANFQSSLAEKTYYAFSTGNVRFIAMNAFDRPEPPSFAVLPAQLAWVEEQLLAASAQQQMKVLLLHCYPSDLKEGGDALTRLITKHGVKLVDMGHTHYNEVSHDGRTIYTATRSTGQIEEGPVGFSVTNFDQGVVSWRFFEAGKLPAVVITSPSDERLIADDAELGSAERLELSVRAKVWAHETIVRVEAALHGRTFPMRLVADSRVWEATLSQEALPPGVHALRVVAFDAQGNAAEDEIRVLIGAERPTGERAARDQDNVLEAWPEHGLLGTQLGPNKNGRKW